MRKVLKIALLVIAVLAVFGTFFFLWKKSQPKITVYEVVSPLRDTVETKTVATGNVEPRDEVLIKPQMSGIISEVLKEAGQTVKEGEIIARIKVIPEMGQLNSAESRVRVAEINLEQINETYKRDKELYESEIISSEEFQTSEANYKKAKEELLNAQDALDIIRDGITKKYSNTSTTQVRSTITGMILDVPIKVGNSVIQSNTFNDGTTIATVADMSDMVFKGKIDETEVGRVHRKFDAKLEYVAPKGANENGAVMFEIKAAVDLSDDVFVRAGYSANAEIVLKRVENVLTLPENTVTFEGDSAFVYLVKQEEPEQVFEKHAIETGLSDGIKIEIKSGIAESDKVRGNVIEKNN